MVDAPATGACARAATVYTEAQRDELLAEVFERIASGESLRGICEPDDMPTIGTVMRWIDKTPERIKAYCDARERQADTMADDILKIADDTIEDKDSVARAKLRISTRQWIAEKLKPRKYGNIQRLEHSGPDGDAIRIEDESEAQRARLLNSVMRDLGADPDTLLNG